MNVELELTGALEEWAKKQDDAQAAIVAVLEKHIAETDTPVIRVTAMLISKVPAVPEDMEFEIPQIVGSANWETLSRSERLNLGKEVKRNPERFGLEFVRKSTSNHAIYKRKI